MKILVANLGSTSYKYRLLDMADEGWLARGGVERIGAEESRVYADIAGHALETRAPVPDHADAIRRCFEQLTDPQHGCLQSADEVAAIGFKAVHGGRMSGVQHVTPELLDAMEEMNQIAPAHNPPYIAAMRLIREKLPDKPLVAAFETAFHLTIPPARRHYAVPYEWAEQCRLQKWGFHGASHRYIVTRIGQLMDQPDLRVISCHLGGSSSLCAARDGKSVATSMGMSPQSGLPQNNRVGDFDPFALPLLMQATGKPLEGVLNDLAEQSGLLGLSGLSGDIRDLEQAAAEGHDRARLALDVYVESIRHYLGGMLVALGGVDALVFTGGIGENSPAIREGVCRELEELGIALDASGNTSGKGERRLDGETSRTQIWVVPTKEELVVARQVQQLLKG